MSASEFDQLISRNGVLMAGRFGPDWTVAEHSARARSWRARPRWRWRTGSARRSP